MEKETNMIKYQNSFIAFLDILGFKNRVIESQNSQETLKILIDSLNICGAFPSGGKKVSTASGIPRTISIQSRFFSDSIVFFMKEDSTDISQLFFIIRYLQDRLWENGICLRGAVTIGDMYWPAEEELNVTLGPGLIETYKLESEIAIYPRILVSEKLNKYIKTEIISANPFGSESQLKDLIRQDNDGMYFLDLLNTNITRAEDEILTKIDSMFSVIWSADPGSNSLKINTIVDQLVSDNIDSEDEKTRQKYQWLKNYKDSTHG